MQEPLKIRSIRIPRQLWDNIQAYARCNEISASEFIREATQYLIERHEGEFVKAPMEFPSSSRQFKTTRDLWLRIQGFAARHGVTASELIRQACQGRINRDARARAMLEAGARATAA